MTRARDIPDVIVTENDVHRDIRGSFVEAFDDVRGFDRLAIAHNTKKHTLRGLHYRDNGFAEEKLVTCTSGAFFDVVLDMRPGPSYLNWFSVEVHPGISIFIPRGIAHGYMTLEDDTDVVYLLSGSTPPDHSRQGVRWNDPKVAIEWPALPSVISIFDGAFPLLP